MAYIYKGRGRAVKRGKRVPSKRGVVKKALAKRSNMNITKVVKRVLNRQAETKVSQEFGSLIPITLQVGVGSMAQNAFTITSGSANFTTGCNIIPVGNTAGDRIGQEIKVKGHYFNYQIVPRPYNVTTNPNPEPCVVKMWFVKPKVGMGIGVAEVNFISNATTSNFFECDTVAECGLNGNLGDLMKSVDRDNYQLIATRTHKVYWSGISGGGSTTAMYGYANNDFKFMAQGRVKVPGLVQKFNLSNNNPQNQPVYCIIQVLNADGSIPPSSHQAIDFRFVNKIYYTDL